MRRPAPLKTVLCVMFGAPALPKGYRPRHTTPTSSSDAFGQSIQLSRLPERKTTTRDTTRDNWPIGPQHEIRARDDT